MRRIRMASIEIDDIDPATMSVLKLQVAPAVSGNGNTDWLCGDCNETLLYGVDGAANASIVFRCPHCFRFSRFCRTD